MVIIEKDDSFYRCKNHPNAIVCSCCTSSTGFNKVKVKKTPIDFAEKRNKERMKYAKHKIK